jgi:hypothetical protein
MSLRERIAGREREVVFWSLVAISTALYVIGGRSRPVGGWILRRTTNVLEFWASILSMIVI